MKTLSGSGKFVKAAVKKLMREDSLPDPLQQILEEVGPPEAIFLQQPHDVARLYSTHLNGIAVSLMRFLGLNRSFVRAKGAYLYDEKGDKYLDFFSAFGALNLGHEPNEILEALRLAEGRPNFCQAIPNMAAVKLAQLLCRIAPGKMQKVFFANSGTEAVEAGLKLARIATGRLTLLSVLGAYHGKTFGSLSVSGREKYRKPFSPLVSSVEQIPYDDLEQLENRLKKEDVAGFIVEPIQGENGVRVPRTGYLKEAEKLCRRYGTLLIVDEVQTGLGRTGRLFESERDAAEPDILILSKAMSGGAIPIGAMLTRKEIWNKAYGSLDTAFLHSSTFGGNTRACVCAFTAVYTILKNRLFDRPAVLGPEFLSGLQTLQTRYPILTEVRGRGFMLGISMARLKGKDRWSEGLLTLWAARQLVRRHRIVTIFTLNHLDTLRIAPPLITEKPELDRFLNALEDVLKRSDAFRKWGLVRSPGLST